MSKLLFFDTETTSLRPDRETWEWAFIEQDGTEHHYFQWVHDLPGIDPASARINGIFDRAPQFNGSLTEPTYGTGEHYESILAEELWRLTRGATIVGICPDFDVANLTRLLEGHGFPGLWHHDLLDVRTFARGYLLGEEWSSSASGGPNPGGPTFGIRWAMEMRNDAIARALGVEHTDVHTAMGDARFVRDLWGAMVNGK